MWAIAYSHVCFLFFSWLDFTNLAFFLSHAVAKLQYHILCLFVCWVVYFHNPSCIFAQYSLEGS